MSSQYDYPLAISLIYRKIEIYLNKLFDDDGITAPQMLVLSYIVNMNNKGEEICGRTIESKFSLSNPAVTGILQRLELKGLIERTASHDDSRKKQIYSTAKAKDMLSIMEEHRKQALETLTSGIPEENLLITEQTLAAILNNVCHSIDDLDKTTH